MPFSKSQLAENFNLSKSAVNNRLSDCGLDTSKTEYTDEEIETKFKVACDLMNNGYSRKEVREYFDTDDPESTTTKTPQPNPNPNNPFSESLHILFTQAVTDAVSGFFQQETEKAIQELLPYTPHIVRSQWQKVIESGEFAQAFINYRNSVANQAYEVVYEYNHEPAWGLGAGEVSESEEEEVLGNSSTDDESTTTDDENQDESSQ